MSIEQFIVFKLSDEQFGINIKNIREIVPYKEATPVPDTAKFIKGIVNHRDSVIPIINLKERLGLGEFTVTNDSRIIIITLDNKDIGFIVDEASQTIMLEENQIDPAPDYITNIEKKYIIGVGKLENEELLILIDLEKILSKKEIEEVEKSI